MLNVRICTPMGGAFKTYLIFVIVNIPFFEITKCIWEIKNG